MLAYAFQDLSKNNYEDIAKEDFEHIQDMFAEILFKGSIRFQRCICYQKCQPDKGAKFSGQHAAAATRIADAADLGGLTEV